MTRLKRTTSKNEDFINLVEQLDTYLNIIDGDEHEFYNQFNGVENLDNVIIIYKNNIAAGCGTFKKYNNNTVEIKRMFVDPNFREFGIGRQILTSLEDWAKEIGYTSCILETGKRMTDAVIFYKKCGYSEIEKYGQYINIDNSLCFKKELF